MLDALGYLNTFLGLGTIFVQLLLVVLLGSLLYEYATGQKTALLGAAGKYGLHGIFFASLFSAILTLVYSDFFGFVPCSLCWYQRICLYPIALISGIALIRKHTEVIDYLIALSIPGALIALYHHYLQMGGVSLLPCSADGISGASGCANRFFFEFGYITFPLMSFTIFLLIIMLSVLIKRHVKAGE